MARILVIDDEDNIRTLVHKILAKEGHDVMEAADGEEGLVMFEKECPDLIITDIIMPKCEGVELIAQVKKKRPETKIVGMSGGGQARYFELLRVAINAGADTTLEKPFRREELLRAVSSTL